MGLGGLLGGLAGGTPLIGGLMGLAGGYMQGEAAKDAAETQANAQREAARIAAEAARFTPVGVTSRFGSSQFGYDPSGRLSSAGYTLTPEMRAYQDQMMGMLPQGLQQYQQAQGINQPLMQGAQGMFGLGQGYLATSPQEQAQKYMAEQQGLLAPGREQQLAQVRQGLFNTGRQGLAMGATDAGGMMATNPEMAAYYNAIAQQDAQLAAQSTQGGMDYAKFGAGMMGLGSQTMQDYYGNQVAAIQPWQTTMGLAQGVEGLGQGMMDVGAQLGGRQASAGAAQGGMLQSGMNLAAGSQAAANAYSPWANVLQGAGGMLQNYKWPTSGGGTGMGTGTDAWRAGGYPM